MANEFAKFNRANVLENVEKLIRGAEQYKKDHPYSGCKKYFMTDICDELSIFDWWIDLLSRSQLKQMASFLKTAGELGYNGYVCFKVGATGCSNGMWAHKQESETGYSPDGEFLYRSFTPAYLDWDAKLADGTMASQQGGNWRELTLKEVKEIIGA